MKKGFLILFLGIAGVTQAQQSLKDALFSGKLKNQPGGVIRKGDDLSTKIDTAQAAPVEATAQTTSARSDSSSPPSVATDTATVATSDATTNNEPSATAPAATPATNNALWKGFMDSVASGLKTDVLSSKKIKRGDYFVLVTYTIETDGQTAVSDVAISPENSFLQEQVKSRLSVDTPRLSPVLNGAGTPRKSVKKYSFTLSKQ